MPNLLNNDTSFSSRQELFALPASPMEPDLDTPIPVQSEVSSPKSPSEDVSTAYQRRDTLRLKHDKLPADVEFVQMEPDTGCGWGAVMPQCLQTFNTPRWVLFFLCVASFLQGMIINGFINTVISSIEKRFNLQSYQSGLIASSYDIAACLCLAFVSYFGGTGHKPRWLGWGVLIMALGSLVFALPHFTTPPYQVSVPYVMGLCSANNTEACVGEEGGLSAYRFVFMLGQFLHGVGATPLYTLGVTYLDENVKSNYAPVYIGTFYTAAIIGPAAGYLLGGFFLNIYTEVGQTTELTPENPLWVGAWWIGFLAGGAAALVIVLPILGYPRQLPGSQRYVSMRVSEVHQMKDGSQKTATDPQFGKTVKDLPRSMMLLLKNPTFISLCLAGATEATLIAGMSTFGPKFLESQFSLSASEAATWFGYMVVPAGGGGTFLGGYIINKMNLRCKGINRLCVMCALISLVSIFIFLISCPTTAMAGVTAPYYSAAHLQREHHVHARPSEQKNLTAECNAGCHCDEELFNPVCGADGVTYYSPCYAACTSVNTTLSPRGKKLFSGCGCVMGNVSWGEAGLAEEGKCMSFCNHMPLFLVFLFVVIFFTFLCSVPALTATLRCVPDSQRSFALGIQWILVRTLGGIPGPVAFGSVIDVSCLLWEEQCGEHGSCFLYHNSAMSQYMLTAGIIYKFLGAVFFSLAIVFYQAPPESPRSSSDSTDLPIKDQPPQVIANPHARP